MTCRKIEVTKRSQSDLMCIYSIVTPVKYIGKIVSIIIIGTCFKILGCFRSGGGGVNRVYQWFIFLFFGVF